MPRRLGARLVQIVERGARKLELPGGLEADRAVGAGQRDDLARFLDRLPAEFGEARQQVADAAGLVIARCVKIALGIDELLVHGADPPAFLRLLAAREAVDELATVFYHERKEGG